MKAIACVSHQSAQKQALMDWATFSPNVANAPKHVIFIRIADDTNIWLQSSRLKFKLQAPETHDPEDVNQAVIPTETKATKKIL